MSVALTPKQAMVMHNVLDLISKEAIEAEMSNHAVMNMLVVMVAGLLMASCDGDADLARGNVKTFSDELRKQIDWLEQVGPDKLQ